MNKFTHYDADTGEHIHVIRFKHNDFFNVDELQFANGEHEGSIGLLLTPIFRFMDLPPELRSMVYSYLFEEQKPIEIRTWKSNGAKRQAVRSEIERRLSHEKDLRRRRYPIGGATKRPPQTNILLASKQIHQEAASILYGNQFDFQTIETMGDFLKATGSMVKLVKHITIKNTDGWLHGKGKNSFRHICDAVSLRTIELDHIMICRSGGSSGFGTSLEDFVHDIGPAIALLQDWHMRNKTAISVPQIFKVTSQRCYVCKYSKHSKSPYDVCVPAKQDCHVECDDGAEDHCEEVTSRLRSLLAEELEKRTKKLKK